MLLSDLANAITPAYKFLNRVDFSTITTEEFIQMSLKLRRSGIEPTVANIRSHLVTCITMALAEVPLPERDIIIRTSRSWIK
ncbi:hypothetical protein [Methylomonas sp. TEB]|uniref:hypothetical protein n=1 Tax=Methylomonas sp. TEB TaxID=3398229 RepID=UPI0039F4E513